MRERLAKRWVVLLIPFSMFPLIWIGLGGCASVGGRIDLVPVVDYRKACPLVVRYEKIKRGSEEEAILRGYYDFARYEKGRLVEVGYGLRSLEGFKDK